MRSVRFAVCFLVACGGAATAPVQPRPSGGTSTSEPSAPLPEAPAAEETRAIAGYPAPIEPTSNACPLRGKWDAGQPRALRLRPDGAVFATFGNPTRADVTLTNEGTTTFVELSSPLIRLWGFIPGDELILHAAAPFLVAGYAAPGPRAPLRWLGATARDVAIEVRLPQGVRALVPPRARRPCSELAIHHDSRFHAGEALGFEPESHAALVGAARVTLFAEPGKQPLAELTVTSDGPQVDVIERRGAHAHVMVPVQSLNPLDDVILVGWVSASLLRPRESGFGGSWGSGGAPAIPSQPRRRDARTVACAHQVPLVAELAGERHLAGMLAADVAIDVVPDARTDPDDLVDVVARSAGVALAAGARLLTKRSELAGCADVRGRTW